MKRLTSTRIQRCVRIINGVGTQREQWQDNFYLLYWTQRLCLALFGFTYKKQDNEPTQARRERMARMARIVAVALLSTHITRGV